jgi:hypothetical protein
MGGGDDVDLIAVREDEATAISDCDDRADEIVQTDLDYARGVLSGVEDRSSPMTRSSPI